MAQQYDLVGRPRGIVTIPEPHQISVDGATVTNLGPGTVSYADRYEDLIAGSADGTIAPGGSVTLDGVYWFSVLVESSSSLGDPVRASLLVGSPPVLESSGILQAITVNTSDASGRPTSVTEGGVTTTYTYNADGTVATETRDSVTRTFSYDASGNLTGATVA